MRIGDFSYVIMKWVMITKAFGCDGDPNSS
jgi:hypothetical protein